MRFRPDGTGSVSGRRTTLDDVAREAGVSLATASRVLNGNGIVRPDSRDRVVRAASRIGYRPNVAAQAMARGYSQTVAIVVTDLRDAVSSAIAQGAITAAAEQGLIGTVTAVGSRPDIVAAVREIRVQRPRVIIIEARIVADDPAHDGIVAEFAAQESAGGRVVLVGASDLPFAASFVDERGAGHALGAALAGIGYQRPLILRAGGVEQQERARGASEGFHQAKDLMHVSVVDIPDDRVSVDEAVGNLLRGGKVDADVIVCLSDDVAIAVMASLRRHGITPGAEVGVAGFGGTDYADDVRPRLTTVDIFAAELGYRAMAAATASGPASTPDPTHAQVRLAESTPGVPQGQ